MKQLVKGSAVLTAVGLGEMVMRFVRTKCIALFLGPGGTGFLAQLMIFFEMLRVLGDLGSRRGVIKQIAEQRQAGRDSDRYGEIIKTSYFLAIAASGVTGLLVTIFSPAISQSLYGTPVHYPFIVFTALLLPVASISTVTASIVKGNLDYTPFAKYTFASYVVVMIATPFFIYFLRYWGAVLVQGFFFIFPLVSYVIFNSRSKFISFSKKINIPALREQVSYGFVQVYQDSLLNFSKVLIAAWIVKGMGLASMGLYQVVITFSTVYMAIPIQAMSGYSLPLIAGAQTMREVTLAINESLRFVMFLLAPVIIGVMVLSEFFIQIFFSRDFLAAAAPLQIQLWGTFFLLTAFPFGVALQARGRLKALLVTATVAPILYAGLFWLLYDFKQLIGVAIAFAAANLVSLMIQYYQARRYFDFHLFPKNQRLLIATAVWMGAAWWAGTMTWEFRLLALGLVIPWFLLSSKQHERAFLAKNFYALRNPKRFFEEMRLSQLSGG